MIDDVLETSVPTPTSRPRRVKISVAAVALVAVLAGGLAVATSGDKEPEPLALVAGNAQGNASAERASGAPSAAPMAAADAKMSLHDLAYWGGIEYEVDGDLPDLGDRGTAWRVLTPDLDREAVSRWAAALGLTGTPERRDGAWVVESSEANFSAYPGDGWSISFNRTRTEAPTGEVSAASAERRARDLLEGLGVLDGEWRVQVSESEIGVGYACAEDLKLRQEEMARLDPDGTVSSEPASMPPIAACPPPPPAVKAQNVSFFPVVGGMRTEWGVWSVTVGPEGIENLYGNWVTFEQGDEYKLRSVDAALEELRQGSQVMPMATEPVPAPMPMPVDDTPNAPPTDPATDPISSGSGGGTSGSAGSAAGVSRPAIAPYPCPPEADCQVPEPQVVTITDVELTLTPNAVYSDGTYRMYLVPGYRFTGTFEGGEMWETTMVALHQDAIAPPPMMDAPSVKGSESTTLPMPASDPSATVMTGAPPKPSDR